MIAASVPSLATILWQQPALLPAAVALLAVTLAAVLFLYLPQVRALPRRWRWLPPTMRAAAVLAMAASVVQPAVLRPRSPGQQGAIVLLVDRSHSMRITDRDRSPAELVALASALGALPEDVRKAPATGVAQQLEAIRAELGQVNRARGDAEYARLSGRGAAAAEVRLQEATRALRDAIAALHDEPRSAASVNSLGELPQRIAELKRLPGTFDDAALRDLGARLSAATAAAADAQALADAKLFAENQDVRDACNRIGDLSRAALVERALTHPSEGISSKLPAGVPVYRFTFGPAGDLRPMNVGRSAAALDAVTSDVKGAVPDALRRLRGRTVQAVVLFSDGRQVGGDEQQGADLSALGVPVFAVAATPKGPAPDVSIVSVDAPAAARVGETFGVRIGLRAAGLVGKSLDLRLEIDGRTQTQSVNITEDPQATAEFDVTPQQAGPTQIVISVGAQPGELSTENNRVERWVKVSADRLRLIVLAGSNAGRQLSSIHDALGRLSWISSREVREGEVAGVTPAVIAGQDVVVLCDLPATALSDEQWSALDRLVRQRGGTVLLCAGAQLPLSYTTGANSRDWLPFDANEKPAWRTWPGGEPHFRLVPERSDPQAVAQWNHLPAVARIAPVARLRPGVRAVITERDSGMAVMTEAVRGAGGVIYLGTDEAWRWQRSAGASDSFWPQLLRRAGAVAYAVTQQNVSLDADTLAPQPEQSIAIRARVFASDGEPIESPPQTVHVVRGEDEVASVTLHATGSGDGRFEGQLEGLPEGDYALRLDPPIDLTAQTVPEPVSLPLHVAPDLGPELADLSGDHRLLRRLAESSGGQFLTLEDLPTLPRLLLDERQRLAQVVEYPLWDSPYLFGFVLACLSTEWAVRKKLGLA